MSYMVGVDIGGTFTDCAVFDDQAGRFITGKAATTPQNPAEGFFNALEAAASAAGLDVRQLLSSAATLVNGTTVGTNAIVTKRGAKVGSADHRRTRRGAGDHARRRAHQGTFDRRTALYPRRP